MNKIVATTVSMLVLQFSLILCLGQSLVKSIEDWNLRSINNVKIDSAEFFRYVTVENKNDTSNTYFTYSLKLDSVKFPSEKLVLTVENRSFLDSLSYGDIWVNLLSGRKIIQTYIIPLNISKDWSKIKRDVFVPDDIDRIRIGVRLSGKGVAEYKQLQLIVDSSYKWEPSRHSTIVERVVDTLRRHSLNRNRISDTIKIRANSIAVENRQDAINYLIGKLDDKHASLKENINKKEKFLDKKDQYPFYQLRKTAVGDTFSYVKIPSLTNANQDFHKAYADSLYDILSRVDKRQLVIDLRGNSGGILWPMLAGICPLIPDGIQGYFSYVDGRLQPITVENGKAYSNKSSFFSLEKKMRHKNDKPEDIFVLVDERTASSAEMLAIVMMNYSKFKLCGKSTAGFLTGVSTFTFDKNLTLRMSTSNFLNKNRDIFNDKLVPTISTNALIETL